MATVSMLVGIGCLAYRICVGAATFRKGQDLMFWLGIIFPILWIVGAFVRSTPRAAGVG